MRRIAVLALALAGCAKTVTPGCDLPVEAGAAYRDQTIRDLDLLFVVDDSSSMAEEQASLAAEIPRLVHALTSGDLDDDGDVDFDPPRSIHVGVVGTDMGTGGVPTPTCEDPIFGGDARLASGGCSTSPPAFLAHDPGGDVVAFETELACAVSLGTEGCGFEQPLEAALKALSPAAPATWTAEGYLPPAFFMGTAGHGDGAHDGFLRHGALLAIVPVTDEDDCSIADPAFLDPAGPYADTPMNLRCADRPEALHPIARFVDGLLALRARPGMLIFAPIVGVPPDLAPGPGEAPDWERLVGPEALRDPRMIERPDPDLPGRLAASCDVPGRGQAFPPVRIAQVAEGLARGGAEVTLASICEDGLGALVAAIARPLRGPTVDCVARAYARQPDRSLACTLELAPAHATCAEIPGATPILDAPPRDDGRPVCALAQRVATEADVTAGVAPAGDGWWYDEHVGPFVCGGPPSRIALPELPFDTLVTLRCTPETLGIEHLGDACAVDEDCGPRPTGPIFDPPAECIRGACRQPCEDAHDCRRADLVDAICLEGACAPSACAP